MAIGRGLDTTRPDELTDEERALYEQVNIDTFGHPLPGLEMWLDVRPDVLKRYRAYTDSIPEAGGLAGVQGYGFLAIYVHRGYRTGIRYVIRGLQRTLTKAQVFEALGVVFLDSIGGPIGMAQVAAALEGYEWLEPQAPPVFPAGWAPDPGALRSGVDFSRPAIAADAQRIEEWYLTNLGEVPPWVRHLARSRPDLLKAHRNRVEHTLRELPKQLLPLVMIMSNVELGLEAGVREGVLLGRAFGMTRTQVSEAILQGALKGGIHRLNVAEAAAGDILDAWR